MKQLFIHIGPHKTGTTAIQNALRESSEQLAKLRIRYDTLEDYGSLNTHQIADSISTGRLELPAQTLEKFSQSQIDSIISSENFSRLDLDGVRFLKSKISCEKIRIIYFLRNPLKRMKSEWQELVKHGYRYTFLEFIAARLSRPVQDRFINDEVRIAPWREVFGIDSVDIHLYDQIEDVVEYFFNFYLKMNFDAPKTRVNKSQDPETTEVLRALLGLQRVFLDRTVPNISEFKELTNNVKLLVARSEERYLKSFSMSMDSLIFRNIESTLIERNNGAIHGDFEGKKLFNDRSVTWKFISPDLWLEHPDLTAALFSLREGIIRSHGMPPIDIRLAQI